MNFLKWAENPFHFPGYYFPFHFPEYYFPFHFPGYYFLNEINAVPSLEGMARMITRTSKDLVGAISGYFKVNSIELSQIFVFFSEHTNFYSDLKIGKCGHHA